MFSLNKPNLQCYLLSFHPVQLLDALLYLDYIKFEYGSTIWDYTYTTNSNKPEHIQRQFTALCY